ncbi:MAG: DUF2510 domain-containing protein [Nitriliruptoraceae bacterium]
MSIPAAWHPDPTGRHEYRYWDGQQWTDHVADQGQASIDPVAGGGAGAGGDAADEAAGGADASEGEQPSAGDSGWTAPESSPAGTDAGAAQPAAGQPATPSEAPAQGQPTAGGGQSPPTWGQQPAPAAGGGQPPATGQSASSGLAVAALIIGILSLLVGLIPFIGLLGVVGGIIALILGLVGRSKAKRGQASGGGMALAGAVIGVIGMLVAIGITVFAVTGIQRFGSSFTDFAECMEETGDEAYCEEQLEQDMFERFFSD